MGGKSNQDIFEAVYTKRMWRPSTDMSRFSSGSGSHKANVAGPYVTAVTRYVESLAFRPNAVDLGCGDFAIGSVLRPLFDRYIACDIVEDVLAQNRAKYKDLDVDFRRVDIAKDSLPPGDLVFVRQVFQHLSNQQIALALQNISARYSRLVLTEHLPLDPNFRPNVDICTGPDTRLSVDSGVDITQPPFDIRPVASEVICEIEQGASLIRTTVYSLRGD